MTLAADTHGFLSPTGVEIAFLLVGLVTLGAAAVTVTTRRLVHAALWLVVALGGLAVEYLLLTAEFIAWVQVLIYVGSVVVLLLFGLMLTRAPIGHSPDADSGNRWTALTVAVAAGAALVWVVADAFRTTWIDLDGEPAGTTRVTGESLFQHWVLPFEALSVLLLAALVGAIVLSRKTRAEARANQTGQAAATTPGTPGAQGTPAVPATPGSPAGQAIPGTGAAQRAQAAQATPTQAAQATQATQATPGPQTTPGTPSDDEGAR
ncbi:NADH-quinone oxidoreductase subunit J [Streptomyces sp. NPDC005925]|uniref:NADH-quinone oxidoreductase subunit J family protein n=1 Tax=Streptomyces sp. NPDC005925 TaxID=3157172 RepID=UPI0033CEDEEF